MAGNSGFPEYPGRRAPATVGSVISEPTLPSPSSIRVLVADDSPVFLSSLTHLLDRSRALTVVAQTSDGVEATRLCVEHKPDLAILDLSMPRKGGLETAAGLRRLGLDLRIIIVSIHDGPDTAAQCRRHGADSFINKVDVRRRVWPEIARLFPALDIRRPS